MDLCFCGRQNARPGALATSSGERGRKGRKSWKIHASQRPCGNGCERMAAYGVRAWLTGAEHRPVLYAQVDATGEPQYERFRSAPGGAVVRRTPLAKREAPTEPGGETGRGHLRTLGLSAREAFRVALGGAGMVQ